MLHMTEKREKGGTGGKRVDQTEPLSPKHTNRLVQFKRSHSEFSLSLSHQFSLLSLSQSPFMVGE